MIIREQRCRLLCVGQCAALIAPLATNRNQCTEYVEIGRMTLAGRTQNSERRIRLACGVQCDAVNIGITGIPGGLPGSYCESTDGFALPALTRQ